jgi:DNA-binding NtrC family response regulator
VRALIVVEDDEDVQDLIAAEFSLDRRFSLAGIARSAEEGFDMVPTNEPVLIVLDHALAGELTGLEAAPAFRNLAPLSKIILFTCHAGVQEAAAAEPAVDAFVLKTDSNELLRVAQQVCA